MLATRRADSHNFRDAVTGIYISLIPAPYFNEHVAWAVWKDLQPLVFEHYAPHHCALPGGLKDIFTAQSGGHTINWLCVSSHFSLPYFSIQDNQPWKLPGVEAHRTGLYLKYCLEWSRHSNSWKKNSSEHQACTVVHCSMFTKWNMQKFHLFGTLWLELGLHGGSSL